MIRFARTSVYAESCVDGSAKVSPSCMRFAPRDAPYPILLVRAIHHESETEAAGLIRSLTRESLQ